MLDFYGVSSLFFFIEPLAEYTSFRGVCTRDGTLSSELFRFPFRFFFSFSLFFFFFGRALSSCIGSVLLIVTALSSFVDFENENATSQSFQPSNRPVVYRFSSSRRPETGGKLFSREEKERERERSDSSRNDSLECNKRAKEAVERTKEALVRRL